MVIDGLPHVEWSWRLAMLFLYSGLIGSALAYWAMSMVNKSISALTTSLGTTEHRSSVSPVLRSCWTSPST
nr:hypothetical protein [Bradyrhizobium sp. Rc3b]